MSRILVTGASGFVGHAVVRALRADGHTLSGTTRAPDRGQGPEGIPLYRIPDLADEADWSRIVAGADIVVHLAARAHQTHEQGTAALAQYRAANRDGSRRLAEAAAAARVKRFVFMSSVKAAGEESRAPLTEDDKPCPEDAYGISKHEAEQALSEVAGRTGLELVVLRPPLVYGPHARGNLLTLMRAIDRGWPLPLGGIDNQRSLISAANLASAVSLVVQHPYAVGSTFFVSDGRDVSTPELVRRLAAALGRSARLIPLPPMLLRAARHLPAIGSKASRLVSSLQVDSRRIRERLGWQPAQSLDDGLAEMAAWFRASGHAK
jgi:nucleoside-diphosphate-sugar epimerase